MQRLSATVASLALATHGLTLGGASAWTAQQYQKPKDCMDVWFSVDLIYHANEENPKHPSVARC